MARLGLLRFHCSQRSLCRFLFRTWTYSKISLGIFAAQPSSLKFYNIERLLVCLPNAYVELTQDLL